MFLYSAGSVSLEAHSGSEVVLTCSAPPGTDLEDVVLEWTRSDLERDYMFLYRDGRPYLVYQHPRFRSRVELKDPTLQSGDLSITLRGLTKQDSGRYECHVVGHSHVRKRSLYNTKPIRTIDLTVRDPEPPKAPEPETIQAFPGKDVVLPIPPVNFAVTSVMLKRADDPEQFVFLHGMGHPHHQNPQYDGRVHFKSQDQTEVQDLSLILRDVQPSDNGTYHFHIMQSAHRMKRDVSSAEPDRVIILEVASGGVTFKAGVGFVAAAFLSVMLQI
ncbi:uncharacterized protein [Eucyclogobius newberryi]|uniref:uncharacterized protein n=1 Tax=Eucyclogobius newberryi TaxID=166745 RepID=UPI003B5A287C